MLAHRSSATSPCPALERRLAAAGWTIAFADIALTGATPSADIRLVRSDGRWLHVRIDRLGRCSLEAFQRDRQLGKPSCAGKGRWPLSDQIEDHFLGRYRFDGRRALLRGLARYLADNACEPVSARQLLAAVRKDSARVPSLTQQEQT